METKRHDFDNEFAYIEQWRNTILLDCYFAEKEYLWPDGTVKGEGKKYFYSPLPEDEAEKVVKTVDLVGFQWFDQLYYINDEGSVCGINQE